jgi:hypothetical protein
LGASFVVNGRVEESRTVGAIRLERTETNLRFSPIPNTRIQSTFKKTHLSNNGFVVMGLYPVGGRLVRERVQRCWAVTKYLQSTGSKVNVMSEGWIGKERVA